MTEEIAASKKGTQPILTLTSAQFLIANKPQLFGGGVGADVGGFLLILVPALAEPHTSAINDQIVSTIEQLAVLMAHRFRLCSAAVAYCCCYCDAAALMLFASRWHKITACLRTLRCEHPTASNLPMCAPSSKILSTCWPALSSARLPHMELRLPVTSTGPDNA